MATPVVFEEPADIGQVTDMLTRIQSHYWTRINRDMDRPNMAMMAASWHQALSGLSMRALESALDEWVKAEPWPPQASDLRKIAIRQGATIYDPEAARQVQRTLAENASRGGVSAAEFFGLEE